MRKIIRQSGHSTWYDDGSQQNKYNYGWETWWKDSKRHRLDGPAYIDESAGIKEWYIDGEKLDCSTPEEFERLLKLKSFW